MYNLFMCISQWYWRRSRGEERGVYAYEHGQVDFDDYYHPPLEKNWIYYMNKRRAIKLKDRARKWETLARKHKRWAM